jgi:fatty-acyl-CoA synthase
MVDLKISSMADILDYEKVPLEERIPYRNTYDLIKQGAALDPDATAMSFMLSGDFYNQPMEVPYKDLWAQINRAANMFNDLGIGPNDVVSYLLPNIPHTHYTLWGGEAAGVVNPINPLLEAGTIRDICQAAKTKVLVALADVPGSEIWPKVESIRKDLPDLKAVIRVMGPTDEAEGIYGFDETIAKYNSDGLDSKRQIAPDDICSMYHTGGTTGTPKLAPHTHFNEAAMTYIMSLVGELNQKEAILCGLPLFHVNGTVVTGAFPFSVGAHVVLLSPMGYRDPGVIQNFYKIVDHYKAIGFSCVPTVLSVLLDVPKGDADIGSLRFTICGAAPLSVELFKRFETHSGMKILEGYGLTEGTTASSINPLYGERRVGSIGLRLPYQDMKVFIVDGEGKFEREADVDEIGSICISGPNVFQGYLEDMHNQGVWPKEGWFNTGDLGRMDAEGYFWLTGRKKELIIRGGHNIDPMQVEEPLYQLAGISMAAAVGRPDPHAGEVPVAYVTLQEGSDLTPEKIMEHLKQTIGERAAVPKEVIILDEIPLTPVGKVFKPALRWDAIKRVYEDELKALGDVAEFVDVTVNEDKVHGAMAMISIKPKADETQIRDKVSELLARFTVRYNLEFK